MNELEFTEPYAAVTYESLGIDVQTFYQDRFSGGDGSCDHLADPRNQFDIECSRSRFLVKHLRGGRILDLGCGSAPYGQTIRQHCPESELIGLDMDEYCVRQAQKIYDRAETFCLEQQLPFPDNYFDAVFSADFFGHIEFRHKNGLIREIQRITKPQGVSVHIIESGELEYERINPEDPNDPLLKYVQMEGHVGVESPRRIKERWSRFFSQVHVENAFLYPFYPMASYLAESSPFDPRFRSILASFNDGEKRAAQICLGYICDYLKGVVCKTEPGLLLPKTHKDQAPETMSGAERLIFEVFQKPCGLIYMHCVKE